MKGELLTKEPNLILQAKVTRCYAELSSARENCPHWDYEDDGHGLPCCEAVQDAKHSLAQARKALVKG